MDQGLPVAVKQSVSLVMQSLNAAKLLISGALFCFGAIAPTLAQENTEPLLKLTALAETASPSSLDLELPGLDSPIPIRLKAPTMRIAPRVLASSQGEASWYGPGFFGNRTANGEVFRPGSLTAAHRTLPFGTKVKITNLWNGRSAVVRINDRGPFHGARVIDLAHGAAHELGVIASGTARVKLEVLQ
jgi:rare lipoprotein A